MKLLPIQFALPLLALLLLSGTTPLRAAIAPLSPEKLKSEASLIVTGKVIEITSTVEKSMIETGLGVYRDTVYQITVLVSSVEKGDATSSGETIRVIAWQPKTRIPPLPGPQGHNDIPEKGDTVTVFLKESEDGKTFEPLLPNGIDVEK